ncbi:MAG: acyl-CoA dehydrogenase family protein [Archangium sp.]|nr:acyl-CoA dehydrogenase family protein [Archangium sp.]
MSKLLEYVLAPAPGTQFASSIERAIASGAESDRLGHAFLGGYAAAITALDPFVSLTERGALCATESGGGHPRAIQTTLENGMLNGTKHFVSGGRLATVLLVVAKTGDKDGRPELKVARIAANKPGVTVEQGAPLDFIPEVPHGAVTFKDAAVDAILEGDGYERYLKPFRTIEDLHVFGAVLGCLVANGRQAFPQSQTEQLLGLLCAILTLGREDPRSPAVHLALAGVLTTAHALVDSLDLTKLDAGFRERFLRDQPLLRIAGRVREQRRLKAWGEGV